MAHLSRWLALAGLDPMLGYLRGLGLATESEPAHASGPLEVLLAEFTGYLIGERDLAEQTVINYHRAPPRRPIPSQLLPQHRQRLRA